MGESNTSLATLKLLGGRLCLDFANTVEWHASDHPQEWLASYSDLVLWGQHAGILTKRKAQQLFQQASDHAAGAAAVLEQAITLREAIYGIFAAVAHGRQPKAADLAALNEALPAALAQSRIVSTAEGFAWEWAGNEDALARLLWPLVRSAAELLTSRELHRVGQCADDRGCGWLFLDTSRNHARRWCDMKDCGNRAKVREHYKRKRTANALGGQAI